ncbi:MAG: hypothetical protein LBK42_14080 [Propionibacteriaceae bacterium]|jgi:hypothetical protein|nr:hypothetical protein [Propionibacteriaceae bacterium]
MTAFKWEVGSAEGVGAPVGRRFVRANNPVRGTIAPARPNRSVVGPAPRLAPDPGSGDAQLSNDSARAGWRDSARAGWRRRRRLTKVQSVGAPIPPPAQPWDAAGPADQRWTRARPAARSAALACRAAEVAGGLGGGQAWELTRRGMALVLIGLGTLLTGAAATLVWGLVSLPPVVPL